MFLQTTLVDPKYQPHERLVEDGKTTGDSFVALDLHSGATNLARKGMPDPVGPSVDDFALQREIGKSEPLDLLHFVPYYFRANRKGKGHMRVGLRKWHR